jgi:hypothetical protein
VCAAALIAAAVLAAPAATAADARGDRSGFPTYVKGRTVNAHSGTRLGGILVTLRDPVTLDVVGSDRTNTNGVFRINGLRSDEYAIKFNGSRRGFETGFGACDRGVVAHYGDACTFAPGGVGKFHLDRL